MVKTYKVVLTPEQMAFCERIAHLRNDGKARSRKTFNDQKLTPYEMHFKGTRGEVAAALFTMGMIDEAGYGPLGDRGGYDVILGCGCGISIKTRSMPRYDFMLNYPGEIIRTRYVGLCWLDVYRANTVWIRGWFETKEFYRIAVGMNRGHGTKPGLGFQSFRDMAEMKQECPSCRLANKTIHQEAQQTVKPY